ncbi:MAG: RHS repeat-associated core domain-containing protein, partial [Candidatus Azobacteroides sp.]|nr:RHS repeat-associated core domain-containing protein [Candidatus Azobacteroides sp.]
MKKIQYIPSLMILWLYPIFVYSQNPGEIIELSSTPSGGEIKACHSVILKPGFSFTATSGQSLLLKVDPDVCNAYVQKDISLSSSRNYIVKVTPLDETDRVNITGNSIETARNVRSQISIQYFDGLERPVELVQAGVTPLLNDLVTCQEYDEFGRKSKTYLPVPVAGNNGAFVPDIPGRAPGAYNNDKNPYSETKYEPSPLNRVIQQYGPGYNWRQNGKMVKTAYLTNTSSFVVPYFTTTDTRTTVSITRSGYYANAQLYITTTTDEDGNVSYEAEDKLGQLVYTKQMNGNEAVETCYIYDNFGNLRTVLPPLAVFASGTWTESVQEFKDYAYAYKYDDRNRCIAKKIPGAEWIYYVYDNADRLIFTQDGENRKKGEWQFSIPDAIGRVVLTGICKNSLNYAVVKPLGSAVVKATYNTGRTNLANSYTITGVSLTNMQILSAGYYDDYAFMGMTEVPDNADTQYNPESGYATRYTTSYKGVLTGTVTAQLAADGTVSSAYLYSVMYYDNKGRVIQTKSNNHLSGGLNKEYIAYSFTGRPVRKKQIHSATGKTSQTEVYTYDYDHAERLSKETHQLNNGTVITLAENTYDELGRLKTGQKHNLADLKTTYTYNIRSWIKSIGSPLFQEELYYESGIGMDTEKCYNGNLLGMTWKFPGEYVEQGYNFYYDNLSRLTAAKFWRGGSYSATDNRSVPSITYDKHGNIKTLQRYGNITASTYGPVDDLTMTYNGNQLKKVTDNAGNILLGGSADFKNYADTDTEYAYNANGIMNKDLNKGISDIQYNILNLPGRTDIKNPVAEARNEYTYSASGAKLKVVQKWNPNYSTTPVIGSAVNTSALTLTKTTDYVGNIIYENGTLKRILVDGGYIENGKYCFYVKGHLGGNYLVVDASGAIIQKNQYYPFGMSFADGVSPGAQPYKYNGLELDMMHGLNWYDNSARWYDPALGRFTGPDPLAEKRPWESPYLWCGGNPMNAIDPDGRDYYIMTGDGRMVLALKTKDNYDRLFAVQAETQKPGITQVLFQWGKVSGSTTVNDQNLL